MFHALRRGSCDDTDDDDDLLHPDELFAMLWQNDTPQKSCETSGENLSSDAKKPSMPDIGMQNEPHNITQEYLEENTDHSVPSLRNNQGVDLPDNHSWERHGDKGGDSKHVSMKHRVPDKRTVFLDASTGNTRLTPMEIGYSSVKGTPPQVCLKSGAFSNPARCCIETIGGPRTRARARAETASKLVHDLCSIHRSSRRARPYNRAEDNILQKLMDQGLSWEEVGKTFSQHFVGRDLRPLKMRWSSLKLATSSNPTRYSKRKRSCPS